MVIKGKTTYAERGKLRDSYVFTLVFTEQIQEQSLHTYCIYNHMSTM